MPCNHKFKNELELELINYEPVILIVGSFSPEHTDNPATWFYGNTAENYFWDILPRLYGEDSLIGAMPEDWKDFCCRKQIAITDLIKAIDDADPSNPDHHNILGSFSDKAIAYHFDDFDLVNIVEILQRHPTIQNVYLTRSITEAFWKYLWNPVMHYCNRNGLHERRLLCPTDEAAYLLEVYNERNPETPILKMEDYLLMRWKEEWGDDSTPH